MKKEKKMLSDTQMMLIATGLLVMAVFLVISSPLFPKPKAFSEPKPKKEFNLEAFGAFDGCSRYGTYEKAFANCKNGRQIELGNGKECISIERLTREAVERCNISCRSRK